MPTFRIIIGAILGGVIWGCLFQDYVEAQSGIPSLIDFFVVFFSGLLFVSAVPFLLGELGALITQDLENCWIYQLCEKVIPDTGIWEIFWTRISDHSIWGCVIVYNLIVCSAIVHQYIGVYCFTLQTSIMQFAHVLTWTFAAGIVVYLIQLCTVDNS